MLRLEKLIDSRSPLFEEANIVLFIVLANEPMKRRFVFPATLARLTPLRLSIKLRTRLIVFGPELESVVNMKALELVLFYSPLVLLVLQTTLPLVLFPSLPVMAPLTSRLPFELLTVPLTAMFPVTETPFITLLMLENEALPRPTPRPRAKLEKLRALPLFVLYIENIIPLDDEDVSRKL